jgi:uncharacterized YccA/Bax inhibitor family protein
MPSDVMLGLALGAGLGGVHAGAGLVLWHLARHRPDRAFYRIVFGGMVARMMLLLGALALVLWLVPLHETAFIGALFAAFVLGLAAEIYQMARRPAMPR